MGNSIHFRHTKGCSCESVKVFETENVLTWGGLEPPTFRFMPNALTIWAIRVLLSHVFEYGNELIYLILEQTDGDTMKLI